MRVGPFFHQMSSSSYHPIIESDTWCSQGIMLDLVTKVLSSRPNRSNVCSFHVFLIILFLSDWGMPDSTVF